MESKPCALAASARIARAPNVFSNRGRARHAKRASSSSWLVQRLHATRAQCPLASRGSPCWRRCGCRTPSLEHNGSYKSNLTSDVLNRCGCRADLLAKTSSSQQLGYEPRPRTRTPRLAHLCSRERYERSSSSSGTPLSFSGSVERLLRCWLPRSDPRRHLNERTLGDRRQRARRLERRQQYGRDVRHRRRGRRRWRSLRARRRGRRWPRRFRGTCRRSSELRRSRGPSGCLRQWRSESRSWCRWRERGHSR